MPFCRLQHFAKRRAIFVSAEGHNHQLMQMLLLIFEQNPQLWMVGIRLLSSRHCISVLLCNRWTAAFVLIMIPLQIMGVDLSDTLCLELWKLLNSLSKNGKQNCTQIRGERNIQCSDALLILQKNNVSSGGHKVTGNSRRGGFWLILYRQSKYALGYTDLIIWKEYESNS